MSIFLRFLHSRMPTVSFPDVGTYLREKQISPKYYTNRVWKKNDEKSRKVFFASLFVCSWTTFFFTGHEGFRWHHLSFRLNNVFFTTQSFETGLNWQDDSKMDMATMAICNFYSFINFNKFITYWYNLRGIKKYAILQN